VTILSRLRVVLELQETDGFVQPVEKAEDYIGIVMQE
jgi:hypothetical protein